MADPLPEPRMPMPARQLIASAAVLLAVPALASAGTITGTAYVDRNSNGAFDTATFTPGASGTVKTGDAGVAGVVVRAYDNTGTAAGTATTANDGSYSLTTSATGTVRLEFSTPDGYQPSFQGPRNGTSVQFVTDTTTGADFALSKPTEYCQDNPSLVTCVSSINDSQTAAPSNAGGILIGSPLKEMSFATKAGAVTPSNPSAVAGTNVIANNSTLGAVFGVGVDRMRNAYFGTYVKRHSPYGPAGATNTIYRKHLDTADPAAVSVFVTLPGTLPAHSAANPAPYNGASPAYPAYGADGNRNLNPGDPGYSNVYSMVGRAGLGDVDVTPDGSALLAVDMDETAPKLWSIPINGSGGSVTAGTPSSVAIPAPTAIGGVACIGKWHPMALGVRGERVLVGGVCSPDMASVTTRAKSGTTVTIQTAKPHGFAVNDWVKFDGNASAGADYNGFKQVTNVPTATSFEYTVGTSGTQASVSYTTAIVGLASSSTDGTQVAGFVQELSAGAFTTIAGFRLSSNTVVDYPKALANAFTNGGSANRATGRWEGWTDGPPPYAPLGPVNNGYDIGSFPQPMMGNIEIADNGDLVLGLRDRFLDQNGLNDAISYEDPLGGPTPILINGGFAAAETVRLCNSAGTFTVEALGACGALTGAKQPNLFGLATKPKPLFYWNGFTSTIGGTVFTHPATSVGGLAMMPGSEALWATAYDIDYVYQQGVKAFGACPARAPDPGTCGPSPADYGAQIAGIEFPTASDSFKKGNGLADLELVCDAAPVQIGNRIWIDTNANGIQDPGEAPVAGVTVRLYDANNTVVGTALTDADGLYYFSSNVSKPAGGDGTNVGGGLVTGAAFTIRLDKPEDFYTGTGPLAPYALTAANQTSPGAGSQSGAVDSTATVVASYPQISVPSRTAGVNNHTYDVGFVTSANPGWPQQESGGGGSGGGEPGGGSNGSGGATSNGGASGTGSGSGSDSGGSSTPVVDPKAASTSAQPSASGLETGRTSRVVIRTKNRRGTTAPSMKTIIRIPGGVEVVAATGGTILANTVIFSASDVRSGVGRSYVLFLRPTGRARTIRMPVTVTMTAPPTITRSVISLRVRRGNPLLPAVTG